MNKNALFGLALVILIFVGAFRVGLLNQPSKFPSESAEKIPQNSTSSMPEATTMKGFNYGFSPNTMTVKQGDMVMLELVSDDSPHTFTIDELDVDQQFTYGKNFNVMFTASKKGTFQFYCAVPGHKESGMVGTLVVN